MGCVFYAYDGSVTSSRSYQNLDKYAGYISARTCCKQSAEKQNFWLIFPNFCCNFEMVTWYLNRRSKNRADDKKGVKIKKGAVDKPRRAVVKKVCLFSISKRGQGRSGLPE